MEKQGDIVERIIRLEERVVSQEKSVLAAMLASERAISKAEAAAEKRFDSVNEFRAQLKDQSGTFLTKSEYDVAHRAVEDKISAVSKQVDTWEGKQKGIGIGWVILLGAMGIISTLVSIVSLVRNGKW